MTDTVVSYEGALRCRAQHADSGAVVLTDAFKDNNGQGQGFSPSELLAVSLGSCILSMAARSMDIDIVGATATVTKTMSNAPKRISGISVHLQIPGQFDSRQRTKLEASAHAYPVHAVLGIDAPMTIDWTG